MAIDSTDADQLSTESPSTWKHNQFFSFSPFPQQLVAEQYKGLWVINKLCLVIYLTKWESQAAMADLAHILSSPKLSYQEGSWVSISSDSFFQT